MALNHRTSSRVSRPGFTLLEVMLAAVLGMIIIFTATGIFAMMSNAKERQAQRMENNLEFATAHRVIQQALRTVVMTDAPDPRDEELRNQIEADIESAAEDRRDIREDQTGFKRFVLQPDPSKFDSSNRAMQTLELTLKTPPVLGTSRVQQTTDDRQLEMEYLARLRRGESLLFADQRIRASRSTRSSYSSLVDDRTTPGASATGREAADLAGVAAGADDRTRTAERRSRLLELGRTFGSGGDESESSLDTLLNNSQEGARAPGLRGVFEFRPEEDPKVLQRAAEYGIGDSGAPVYSLWWREFPADAALSPEQLADDPELAEMARYSTSETREVKLISGLRQARWQVFRTTRAKDRSDRLHLDKIAALHAKELPAYVEFKFETLEGRREHWMFEVSWSTGPEPGTVLTDVTNAQNLADQVQNQLGGDKSNDTGRGGNNTIGRGNDANTIGRGTGGGGLPSQGHTTNIDNSGIQPITGGGREGGKPKK